MKRTLICHGAIRSVTRLVGSLMRKLNHLKCCRLQHPDNPLSSRLITVIYSQQNIHRTCVSTVEARCDRPHVPFRNDVRVRYAYGKNAITFCKTSDVFVRNSNWNLNYSPLLVVFIVCVCEIQYPKCRSDIVNFGYKQLTHSIFSSYNEVNVRLTYGKITYVLYVRLHLV